MNNKDLPQIADLKNNVLYTFGESTVEVDMQKAVDGTFPFERVPAIKQWPDGDA